MKVLLFGLVLMGFLLTGCNEWPKPEPQPDQKELFIFGSFAGCVNVIIYSMADVISQLPPEDVDRFLENTKVYCQQSTAAFADNYTEEMLTSRPTFWNEFYDSLENPDGEQ